MDLYNIFQELEKNKDDEKAKDMEKYMRNQFSFLGIQKPKRIKLTEYYFKKVKKTESINWEFVFNCWEKAYREAQYVGIDYIKTMKNFIVIEDIKKIKFLLINKSWWDTVDGFHRIIGSVALRYPEVDKIMIDWSLDENIWLSRVAINHQLLRKEKMKVELLAEIIVNNLEKDEFFINKAIGWALRDYSKTNPEWVIEFIEENRKKLSKLSIREASKYIREV